jgi:hypothetical protein
MGQAENVKGRKAKGEIMRIPKGVLKGAREKWANCPPEEAYIEWWEEIGSRPCSFCKYFKVYSKTNKKCPLQPNQLCYMDDYDAGDENIIASCFPAWEDCLFAEEKKDYPSFVTAFEAMREKIYSFPYKEVKK